MKKSILFCYAIIVTTILSGQEIRISIGPNYNVFHHGLVNEQPYGSPNIGFSTNLDYIFTTDKKIEFGIGLGYQSSSLFKVIEVSPVQISKFTEKINLCSVSFKSIYKISEEFYLSLDPSAEIQTNNNPLETTENQSGLGLSFAVGGNFRLNKYLFFNVEPRLWMHNLISFHNQDSPFRLSIIGINLGLVIGHKGE